VGNPPPNPVGRDRRVVVTGAGAVTPLGLGVSATWQALLEGRSGAAPITLFDTAGYDTTFAAEVKGFDLEMTEELSPRVGVLIGSGIGGTWTWERQHQILIEKGPNRVSPFFIPMMIGDMASGYVSMLLNAKGPNSNVATACATGTHAIGDAYEIVRRGAADAMVAGGAEAAVSPISVAGFCAMRALSRRNDDPARASRPFDRERDGFVIGEGAGIVILEELERAIARGANIFGEIIGYGMSGDAHHMTAPAPEGEGQARCMAAALAEAQIPPSAVDYINAHGTSTELNDRYETMAIKTVFGEHARRMPVSSTKSMTGHLLGAAGGVELIICLLALRDRVAPPTINYEYPDPDCDLDYVPNAAREADLSVAMSNSFGFGGHNAALLVRRFTG